MCIRDRFDILRAQVFELLYVHAVLFFTQPLFFVRRQTRGKGTEHKFQALHTADPARALGDIRREFKAELRCQLAPGRQVIPVCTAQHPVQVKNYKMCIRDRLRPNERHFRVSY